MKLDIAPASLMPSWRICPVFDSRYSTFDPLSTGVYVCPTLEYMPNVMYIGGMPNVCPSSGTIGTSNLPTFGSRQMAVIRLTHAFVVDIAIGCCWYCRSK